MTAPAAARTFLGPEPLDTDDVELTASSLVYAFDGESLPFGVYERRAGGRVRRLPEFDALRSLRPSRPDADNQKREIDLAASSKVVAVSVSALSEFYEGASESTEPGQSAVAVSRRDGRVRRLVRCERTSTGPVRVDDTIVAYVGAGCRGWIGVRDMATGRSGVVRPPAGARFEDLQIGGRYVAAQEVGRTHRIGVYDWQSGKRLYGAPEAVEFVVTRSGALAVTRGRGDGVCYAEQVAWFSREEPVAHVLPGAACGESLLVAGDLVLWARRTTSGSEDVITRLPDGRTEFLVRPGEGVGWAYFDGPRVGYLTSGCDGRGRVVVDPIQTLRAEGPPPVSPCDVSLEHVRRTARVGRRGRLALRLACQAGCEGSIRLYDPAAQRNLSFYGGSANFLVEEGEPHTTVVYLADAEVRRLARAGRLEVELQVLVHQPAGGAVTRTAPLTLLAPYRMRSTRTT
jgi:hypothetical protein